MFPMKFIVEFLPLTLFFLTYWLSRDIFIATGVLISLTTFPVCWAWLRNRKVKVSQYIAMSLTVVLGGATLLLHEKSFIMWKPTVLYWIVAIYLIISDFIGKNCLKLMIGQQLRLPPLVWRKLTWAWALFCCFMGAMNLFVAYHFSEEAWVSFKLFGGLGLMVAFVIAQSLFLAKYMAGSK